MDEETQKRVFEPFTQADTSTTREYGGTGLGLTISRHYIEVMGGDIAIQSAPGEGTKIILTGDPYQIDNPYVDSSSNGLTYVVEKFKGEDISGHVTLDKGERSCLAELAANLL